MAVFPLPAGTRLMASEHAPDGFRYEIKRVIGQGGFGITYLASDLVLGGQCVVKEFAQSDLCARGSGALDMAPVTGHEQVFARWIERFTYEARLIHRIRHPNVVTVRVGWGALTTASCCDGPGGLPGRG